MGCNQSLFCWRRSVISYDINCAKKSEYGPYNQLPDGTKKCVFVSINQKVQCKCCHMTFIVNLDSGETLDGAWLRHMRDKDRDDDKKKLLAAEDKIKVLSEMIDKEEVKR